MRQLVPFVLLLGCGKSPGEEPPDDVADPVASARGDCTATLTQLDEDDEPLATWTLVHDANGDPISSEGSYTDPELPSWTETWTYDAPHQPTAHLLRYRGPQRASYENVSTTWEWASGDQIRWSRDDGDDGTVDFERVQTFEDHRISYWELDLDGDGTIDDTADWSWTADGEGWSVHATGEDPNGPYETLQSRDAALRVLHDVYSDATGLEADLTYEGWNDLGSYTRLHDVVTFDGEPESTRTDVHTLDASGNPIASEYTFETYAPPLVQLYRTETVWSCP